MRTIVSVTAFLYFSIAISDLLSIAGARRGAKSELISCTG